MKITVLFFGLLLFIFTLFAEARDPAQIRAFKAANTCPATGRIEVKCKGYVVDHRIPLCGGGEDTPNNMQWQKRKVSFDKDVAERAYCNCLHRQHTKPEKNLTCSFDPSLWPAILPVPLSTSTAPKLL